MLLIREMCHPKGRSDVPGLQHIIISYGQGVICVIERPELEVETGFETIVSTRRHSSRNRRKPSPMMSSDARENHPITFTSG